jgi:hypothetical protein
VAVTDRRVPDRGHRDRAVHAGVVAGVTLAPQLAEIGVILLLFRVGMHFSVSAARRADPGRRRDRARDRAHEGIGLDLGRACDGPRALDRQHGGAAADPAPLAG